MEFLDRILTSRRRAVEALQERLPLLESVAREVPLQRDFRSALSREGMSLIAEIKRASPSKGELNVKLDPAGLAASYERGGARALSVLIEPDFFLGSADDLVAARAATSLPVLWKDFVLDRAQIVEACAAGADAVLLIVRILDGDLLGTLMDETRRWGLDALVEIFDEGDLERALDVGAAIVGVNHRDLRTFEDDPTATARLRPRVPDNVTLVAESAITSRADVEALEAIDVDAMLVGEAFVTAADPEAKVKELLGPDAAPAAQTE